MMGREKMGSDRTTITFSLPVQLKKNIEQFILTKNLKNEEKKESVSYFCFKSVDCYYKAQNIKNFNDLKNIWSEIFINNKNINLSKKLELLKEFKKEIEEEIKKLEEYFAYKQLKNLNDKSVKKVESLGEMASWVVAEMKKGKKDEIN